MFNWTAIIVAFVAIIPTTLAVFVAWRSNKKSIQEVHLLINSRMTELLEITGKSEKAKGVLQGRAEK